MMKVCVSLFIIASAIICASGNESTSKVCKPKSHFKISCNDCICSDDGTKFFCTKKGCPKPVKPWGPLYISGTPCTPNKPFYSECNRCICGRNGGSAVCTLIACDGLKPVPKTENSQI